MRQLEAILGVLLGLGVAAMVILPILVVTLALLEH